jgi:hypothetical protein
MTRSSSLARRIIVAEAASAAAGGRTKGKIGFKFAVQCPRVRSYDGHKVALPTWTAAQAEDWLGRRGMNLMLTNARRRASSGVPALLRHLGAGRLVLEND